MVTSLPRNVVLAALALALLPRSLPADPPAPGKDDIARAVRQLGDDSFAVREKASAFLWKAGRAAEPALEEAAKSDDIEVSRRARDLLEKFKHGIYPDTPADVLNLIGQYRAGDPNGKENAVKELLKLGRPGYQALLKLASSEEDAGARRQLTDLVCRETIQAAGALVAAGNYAAAEDLLEMSTAGSLGPSLRNYAAFLLLRGRLDDKVRSFKAKADAGDRHAAEVLTYLYRAKGDLPSARAAAEQSAKAELIEGVLGELGDWKALAALAAKKPAVGLGDQGIASPAAKATVLRLAGDTAASDAALRKLAAGEASADPSVLLFNDRPREALDALKKARHSALVFKLLVLQYRFREAVDLADNAREANPEELFELAVLKARHLYLLGDKDVARQAFVRLADQASKADPVPLEQFGPLIEAEYQVGLADLAFEHAGRALTAERSDGNVEFLLKRLFPRPATAEVWWQFFRGKYAGEAPATRLKRLRDFLARKTAGRDFDELARELEEKTRTLPMDAQREQWLHALTETCAALGRDHLTQSYLEKAVKVSGSPQALLNLGDFLLDQKGWRQAADAYGRAWDKDPKQPAALYLRGYALTQAGQEAEGKKLMERAHWLPLGDDATRSELAEVLAKHRLAEASRREQELILRTGQFQSVYVTNAQNRAGEEALSRGDFRQAAIGSERVMMTVLETGLSFVKERAYLFVPYSLHRQRARALLAAGRADDAAKEVDLALAFLPGDIELAIQLVPAFQQAGRKPQADGLFDKVFAVHAGLCKDYPRSGWCHNNLAWLAARCRRHLDEGLEHSSRAVELDPHNAGHLDTLAEVHFQRGDKGKALELMKKCVELEPKNDYFRKQLRRFEAGDPSADVPAESGE
jgi:Tfp pilus assembly protein PilF